MRVDRVKALRRCVYMLTVGVTACSATADKPARSCPETCGPRVYVADGSTLPYGCGSMAADSRIEEVCDADPVDVSFKVPCDLTAATAEPRLLYVMLHDFAGLGEDVDVEFQHVSAEAPLCTDTIPCTLKAKTGSNSAWSIASADGVAILEPGSAEAFCAMTGAPVWEFIVTFRWHATGSVLGTAHVRAHVEREGI